MTINLHVIFYLGLLYDHNSFKVKHAPYHILYDNLSKDQKGMCWFFILSIKKKFPAFPRIDDSKSMHYTGQGQECLYSRKWSPLQSLFILKLALSQYTGSVCRFRKLAISNFEVFEHLLVFVIFFSVSWILRARFDLFCMYVN